MPAAVDVHFADCDSDVVSVVEELLIIQCSVLVVRSGYTGNVVVLGSMYKVMMTFVE